LRNGPGKDAVKDVSDADLKRFPVETVSWEACAAFIKELNKQAQEPGWEYRLPTEVEWEYACRGGPMKDRSESEFHFYLEKPSNELLQANALYGLGDKGRPAKVGSYRPNALGLYDMHGNVYEWCADKVKPLPDYPNSVRVARGGGWSDNAGRCLASFRHQFNPPNAYPNMGLRVARVYRNDANKTLSR
jgi:formylglycine-generating enzyme required for sulfatase activity